MVMRIKEFKAAWKKAMKKPITMLLNEKYRPDPRRFVCTCPQFVISHFLICKHLMQSFHPVYPIFFLQVTRNRTMPFWTHPSLVPIDEVRMRGAIEPIGVPTEACNGINRSKEEEEEEEKEEEEENRELIDMAADGYDASRETYTEKIQSHITLIRDFCDGLEHQIQFGDHRFLKILEGDGARFLRLAENCINQE